jgi:predicted branched-subunit amino acid permease
VVAAAVPVVTAVGVFGVSYGVLGVAAGVPGWQLVLLSALTFAGSAQFAFVSAFAGALEWLCWVGGSAVGAAIGNVSALRDPAQLGFDAAFPALFIALLWPMLDGAGARRCALGGALAVALVAPWAPAGLSLAAAAVAGLVLAPRGGQ